MIVPAIATFAWIVAIGCSKSFRPVSLQVVSQMRNIVETNMGECAMQQQATRTRLRLESVTMRSLVRPVDDIGQG